MTPTRRGKRLLGQLDRPDVSELLDKFAPANARPKCGPYKTKPGTPAAKRTLKGVVCEAKSQLT